MSTTTSDIDCDVSTLFHDDDADVTFVSSDNVIFKIHSLHLNPSTSIGLARSPQDTISSSEDIDMEESSDVLEIIFQFIEPPPPSRNYKHPSIQALNPDLFFRVAETAENFVIYGATRICYDRMWQLASKYPSEVLNHSTLHGYTGLADKAAEYLLTHPIEGVIPKLTAPGLLMRYLLYSNLCWEKTRDAAGNLESGKCARLISRYKRRMQLQLPL
ncbi:hypothetical protein BDN70DRAFT_896556 [Pholiota conissans]|uniref:BTB domain-containing protein n=1 Tax=Pholiota conissans TaxID=109636 RepID=A0A9P5YX90_9AGAR|nr:hypothetical protein BDN70DRAFT_896556 [Pholiota conissans]